MGTHNRNAPVTRRPSTITTTSVINATSGPAKEATSSGTARTRLPAMGITVVASRSSAVPATTGVIIRRSNGSQMDSSNWARTPATRSAVSMGGPPSFRAGTPTTISETLAAVIRTCPVPNLQTRPACRAVMHPQTISVANAAHTRYCSDFPDTRAVVVTAVMMGVSTSSTPWNPAVIETRGGQGWSGSYRIWSLPCSAANVSPEIALSQNFCAVRLYTSAPYRSSAIYVENMKKHFPRHRADVLQ